MSTTRWDGFDKWHLLFDALCRERGHEGNATLASKFCSLTGRNSRADFEAAKKQFRAWRSGQRLPLRRNASLLGQVLDVESEAGLDRVWLDLYRRAQSIRAGEPLPDDAGTAPATGGGRSRMGMALLAGALGLLGTGLALSSVTGKRHVVSADLPVVNYEGRVRVPIGASVLILGRANDCDGPPPAWEEIADEMPSTHVGSFSDGGLAREVSRRCLREIIVRGIKFTGTDAGSDEIRLFGTYVRVDVVAPLAGRPEKG